MSYIDLHVHSNISDGTMSPEELVRHAAQNGLIAIALTDHDSVEGIAEAKRTAEELKKEGLNITVIPGIEISAGYHKKDIHILGYHIDVTSKELNDTLQEIIAERTSRNDKMCANLQKAGIDITTDKLRAHHPDTVITRAHFARFMVENNYTKTMKEAFDKYLDSSTPYYVSREYLSPKKAITLIKEAGGIPVLAHPLLYGLSLKELEDLLAELTSYGLVGIETFYSNNTGCDESNVRRLARIFNLVMTGGSDYHGTNKPQIQIGIGRGNLRIPDSILKELAKFN